MTDSLVRLEQMTAHDLRRLADSLGHLDTVEVHASARVLAHYHRMGGRGGPAAPFCRHCGVLIAFFGPEAGGWWHGERNETGEIVKTYKVCGEHYDENGDGVGGYDAAPHPACL